MLSNFLTQKIMNSDPFYTTILGKTQFDIFAERNEIHKSIYSDLQGFSNDTIYVFQYFEGLKFTEQKIQAIT